MFSAGRPCPCSQSCLGPCGFPECTGHLTLGWLQPQALSFLLYKLGLRGGTEKLLSDFLPPQGFPLSSPATSSPKEHRQGPGQGWMGRDQFLGRWDS